TNNSSHSASDYLSRLQSRGVSDDFGEVYTSGLAAIAYLKDRLPEARNVYLLGTDSLSREFAANGLRPVAIDELGPPDVVVAAFDTELSFEKLCRAAYWVKRGTPYIATHPDRICPTDKPTVLVDCGAVCACIATATGREPDVVLGKPHPIMLEGILATHGLQPHELAMVGDRLYTDIAMAHAVGAVGTLVLTGEAQRVDVDACSVPPDLVVDDLAEFGRLLIESRKTL
ncbi:MAG: HAD hydrolase-like protein, partial [Planctomycetales bacterium]|nr:HAD hydrolase-like protein [Planctomycetales bacterium]